MPCPARRGCRPPRRSLRARFARSLPRSCSSSPLSCCPALDRGHGQPDPAHPTACVHSLPLLEPLALTLTLHIPRLGIWPAGYLDTIRAVPARWKVLIVDQYTQHMLQSVLSTYDVLEEGIQRQSASPRGPAHVLSHPARMRGEAGRVRAAWPGATLTRDSACPPARRGRLDHLPPPASTPTRRRLPSHAHLAERRPRPA